MQGVLWKLPLLRRVSAMWRGAIQAVAGSFGISLCVYVVLAEASATSSPELAGDLAQIGATLLVAYGVESSWLVKHSSARGSRHEQWVGFAAGLALCGLIGIGCALALSGPHGSATVLRRYVFAWSAGSIGFLGAIVALIPMIAYDWAHSLRTEYTDE